MLVVVSHRKRIFVSGPIIASQPFRLRVIPRSRTARAALYQASHARRLFRGFINLLRSARIILCAPLAIVVSGAALIMLTARLAIVEGTRTFPWIALVFGSKCS